MCLTRQTTEKDPGQGRPLSAPLGADQVELWENTGQRSLLIARYKRLKKKKDSDRAVTPAADAVCVPAHLVPPGHCPPSNCATFTLNSHWGRAVRQNNLASVHAASLRPCLTLCDPVICGLPGFSVREGSSPGKNTGAVLASTGCHALLEHYISCCPNRHLLWVPGAARNPATQAATPPPHLALTEANPSSPGQPQEQTPVDNPHAEVGIKPQLKPSSSVAKEENPKPFHSCTHNRLNPHDQQGDSVYGIYKRSLRARTKQNTLVLIAVDTGGKNTGELDQMRIWAYPQQVLISGFQCWRAS